MFAARDPGEELGGLPDLEVRGLQDADARGLLRSVVRVRLDEQVRDRILAETHGNPLALLELPRGLSPLEFPVVIASLACLPGFRFAIVLAGARCTAPFGSRRAAVCRLPPSSPEGLVTVKALAALVILARAIGTGPRAATGRGRHLGAA
jgi:hypothetical protein